MKQIILRDYQEDAANLSSQSLKKNKRTILCAPCGAGKTVISAAMVSRALDRGRTVWVLVHRTEILQQMASTLIRFGKVPHLVCPGHKYLPGQQLYLCMVETFKRRGLIAQVAKEDIMFCDEAHWGSYDEVVSKAPCYVLGLSATPKASGRPLNEYFADCINPVRVDYLIKNGYLVPGVTYSIGYDVGSKLKVSGKDYHERLLLEEFKSPKLFEGCLEEYERHAQGLKAICYNINVEHSLAVCKLFNDAGYKACHIDGKTDKDLRENYFRSFADGNIDILCNVGVATTGYDEPTIECVIKNYATVQLAKDKQCEGRGARTHPGKEQTIIIDMGRNYLRHGRYGVPHEEPNWVEIFNNPASERRIKGKDRCKECEDCGAVIDFTLSECMYCGKKYTKEEVEKVFFQKAETQEIKDYRLEKLEPHIRAKKIKDMNYTELKAYGEALGYSPKWAGMRMSFRKRGNPKWGK